MVTAFQFMPTDNTQIFSWEDISPSESTGLLSWVGRYETEPLGSVHFDSEYHCLSIERFYLHRRKCSIIWW